MRQIHEVIENRQRRVKKILNSPILINNNELDSLVVNKGLILGELRYFLCISSNSIKSDNELR